MTGNQNQILQALIEANDPEAIPILMDCLGSNHQATVRFAALTIGEMAKKQRDICNIAVGELIDVLSSSDPQIRKCVLNTLLQLEIPLCYSSAITNVMRFDSNQSNQVVAKKIIQNIINASSSEYAYSIEKVSVSDVSKTTRPQVNKNEGIINEDTLHSLDSSLLEGLQPRTNLNYASTVHIYNDETVTDRKNDSFTINNDLENDPLIGKLTFEELLTIDRPSDVISEEQWEKWCSSISRSSLSKIKIVNVAKKYRLFWTNKDVTVSRYLSYSLDEITHFYGFDKNRIKTLILCVASLALCPRSSDETHDYDFTREYTEHAQDEKEITFEDLKLDPVSNSVCRGTHRIEILAKEFSLLHYMMRNPDKVLSREMINHGVFESTIDSHSNIIDVYINYLQKKVDDDFNTKLIHIVRGEGYILTGRAQNSNNLLEESMLVPAHQVEKDSANAVSAHDRSLAKLRNAYPSIIVDDITGAFSNTNKALLAQFNADHKSLVAIRNRSFSAMVKVNTVLRGGSVRKNVLWYAHENTSTTQILGDVVIMPWTHPGIQRALVEDLNDDYEIEDERYTLEEITPLSRARYDQVLPDIIGIYDPGGRVGNVKELVQQTGLKAVKLQMTKDQVKAFISRMKGVLFVTGAPGSGKTTVAFQRMRFLFDAGEQKSNVVHTPETSRVFLANQNLIEHSRTLLEKQLEIPPSIVTLVNSFIEEYLDDAWKYKHDALLLTHRAKKRLFSRGREAFFSTCTVDDLKGCWNTYEVQIVQRLGEILETKWEGLSDNNAKQTAALIGLKTKILEFATKHQKRKNLHDPASSEVRMDKLYAFCAREYDTIRTTLARKDEKKFDDIFLKWLFYVYDPLDAVASYFEGKKHEGKLRIRKGTAAKIDEELIIEQIFENFSDRQYRQEEIPWLAWLLRFALPTTSESSLRFREVPRAESPVMHKYGPWSHIVIDEAQDLSVVEASLISSFVVRDGALTISADFRQVVSPVHGMETPGAFKIGCHLLSKDDDFKQFLFSKNMRQTSQIANFLRGFYAKAFGETAPFVANDILNGPKPQLRIMPYVSYASTIRNALNTFKKTGFSGSMALLQINEDEDEMLQYREMLEKENISLADIWDSVGLEGKLVTTSVERIKGLEYDVCFVFGLEKAENMTYNFNKNRVYVALSRPTQRLFMFCEHFPNLLQGVNSDLYDVFDAR